MSVYIDKWFRNYHGMKMSHMIADSEEELDLFAEKIGLKKEWKHISPYRCPHYDICLSKWAEAILNGAIEVNAREIVRKSYPKQ